MHCGTNWTRGCGTASKFMAWRFRFPPGSRSATSVRQSRAGGLGPMRLAIDADDAAAAIPDGSRIVVPPGAPPLALLGALGRRQWERGIELLSSVGNLPESVIRNDKIRIG